MSYGPEAARLHFDVCRRNYEELRKVLPDEGFVDDLQEPIRLLFNFLASAKMLVLVRGHLFRKTEIKSKYQRQIDEHFKGHCHVKF